MKQDEETEMLLREQNEIIRQLVRSLDDVKKGRIKPFEKHMKEN